MPLPEHGVELAGGTRLPSKAARRILAGAADPKHKIPAVGPWLFPELVAPLLSDPRQAVWVVPAQAFNVPEELPRSTAPCV